LLQKAVDSGLEGVAYPDVNTALKNALDKASKEDLILICGSVFIVGEVSLNHT
jgi:dihydrofolate synthase/folylpolyglutamate synthase